MSALLGKISDRSAEIVVVGAGYVGLPLVAELTGVGFSVTALDSDAEKVRLLGLGESYIADVPAAALAAHARSGRLRATRDPSVLAHADVVVICVPTPLGRTRDPDIRHIVEAVDAIAQHQHADMLIVLESTTYPGTTREVLVPRLTRRFQLGHDVFIAFSPQRIDPGNPTYGPRNTPKVIGAATPACRELATALYSHFVEQVVPVSSADAAEMVKLLENTFRAVNIGLVNEIAIMSRKLGIDVFEVIAAASTKPFGFMPFQPGPGLGGHCIPLDPLYLSWKLRALSYEARFIELADSVNRSMPGYVVERAASILNARARPLSGSRVLVYGVAYKRDVRDVRESPAIAILAGLEQKGARVAYMDPFVPHLEYEGRSLRSVAPAASFSEYDLVIVVTDHGALERERLVAEAHAVLDTRNALAAYARDHVHAL